MIGRTLAHYRITAAIGAGGMGQVYRATDTRLGREVALKMLPAEMAGNPEMRERFRREARAVAALNHQNIVTIYSVEEADGLHFLTMELVQGQSLDRLIPAGGLEIQQIIEIATALSGALAEAHDKGIVHRDLKPANVMVTDDGGVKVLDFGLAKFTGAEAIGHDSELSTAMQTDAGVIMGTRPYMSPEQVQGRTLDHRTDIFSMGVMLYEISTGKRPFHGQSNADLFASILRDTAPPVTDARAELPADLSRVIKRCLEKDPRHRIQTARDIGNELRDTSRPSSHRARIETTRATPSEGSGPTGADQGFRVAVLPFKYGGANADLKALAEGMSEEIVTGLSRFSYLRVIASGSTVRYANEALDVRAIGKEIGATYVMEGSLRQAGPVLRIAVQLVDATTSTHLWADTYNRPFIIEEIFALQDELVPRIVSTVADMQGVLPRIMSEGVSTRPPEQLSPYEAVLRGFSYPARGTAEELMAARSGLELAVQKAPAYGDAWAMLAFLCIQAYAHGFDPEPDGLKRGLFAARRAVELAPANHLGHCGLAQALFFLKEFEGFRVAAERAVALNPMDGLALAFLGELLTYAGDSERGLSLAERAKQLNPHHPGWYWYADFYNAYGQGDDASALSFALRVNMPQHWFAHAALAAAYGQLGRGDAATRAARDLLRVRPDFAATAHAVASKWWNPEYRQRLIDGLRKAGLAIPDARGEGPRADGSAAPVAARADPGTSSVAGRVSPSPRSGESYADEGFWVAVLPLKYSGSNADIAALAEGLGEEIVTGLSRFSYLRVIARGSTLRFASDATDLRAIGKEIGARYVMEGSLRQAGPRLRVAVQLTDAATGAHLWAENYERTFSPEAVFELQDDLVPRIVSTVADQNGILTRRMSETLRSKSEDLLTPHEAVLRAFSYFQRVTPEEHAVVRRTLERATREAPDYADAWAMLSIMYAVEFADDFNPGPDPLDRSLAAALRAVHLAATHALGHYAQAFVYFLRKEIASFRAAAEKASALNPMDGSIMGILGVLIEHAGETERGCQIAETAMQLNPNFSGLFRFPAFISAYGQGKYAEALELAARINMPNYFYAHAARAAAFGQLGQLDAAKKELRELLALRPDFATAAHREFSKWYDPERVEHMIEGLRKAGLAVAIPGNHPIAAVAAGPKQAGTSTVAIVVLPFPT